MTFRIPKPRDVPEAVLATWAGLQTLAFLSERDRFSVVFSLDPVSLPWVALLWLKNLGLAAFVAGAFVGLLRLTASLPVPSEPLATVPRSRAVLAGALLFISISGLVARWALPGELPPGLWCDVAYEAEEALAAPGDPSVWGGVRLGLGGRPSSTMVSQLYLAYCRGVLHVFGQGEAGLRAISVVPATLLPFVGAALAVLLGGVRYGVVAFALLSLGRWPLVFSLWTWTGTAATLLAAGAAAAIAFAVRREGRPLPAMPVLFAGALTGLSFHAHPASAGAAIGLGLFLLTRTRTAADRRSLAVGVAGAIATAAPFFAAYLEHPNRLGGRARDVSVFSESASPGVPRSSGLRLLTNVIDYGGCFLFTGDPNPRHGISGAPSVHPVVGVAVAIGGALALRRAAKGRAQDRLLLALAVGGLLPGILANPSGAPNTTRACTVMVPLFLLAAEPLLVWGSAIARALRARAAFVGVFSLALLVSFETTRIPVQWADDPLVRSYFCPDESDLGRSLGQLSTAPVYVADGAPEYPILPIVLEACAAPPRPVVPIRRFSLVRTSSLRQAPPSGPFWYVAHEHDREALRASGFAVAIPTHGSPGSSGPAISWVRPPAGLRGLPR